MLNLKFSHLHHGKRNLLDHMLISQSMYHLFVKADIFNENLHDESLPFASGIKYPESDHAPFWRRFNNTFVDNQTERRQLVLR